jgi:hypothetical protein
MHVQWCKVVHYLLRRVVRDGDAVDCVDNACIIAFTSISVRS